MSPRATQTQTQTQTGVSWSLVIPTYKREDVLLRSLKLGAEQSRPPKEIVVVDSSPDWERTHDRVMSELAPKFPNVTWKYVKAKKQSSSCQRNEGVALATGDIVFFTDDDCLLYPDCAETVMRVFDADPDGLVIGVNAGYVHAPPDRPEETTNDDYGFAKNYSWAANTVRRLLRGNDLFIPYDAVWPAGPIPDAVAKLPTVERWLNGSGGGMSFRRWVCEAEPFEEALLYYAAGEDSDMSYRAQRHGAFVGCTAAKICHIGSPGGRLSRLTVSTLKALNTLVLARIYTTDVERGRSANRRLLARRTIISLAKDLNKRRLGVPEARGWMIGLKMLDSIFDRSPEELRAWYPEYQHSLIKAATA